MRILTLAHNHPDFHAGGTEILAWALHQQFGIQLDNEVFFVAAVDTLHRQPNPGTGALAHRHRKDVALIWTEGFDPLRISQANLFGGLDSLREIVTAWQPDIVQFHHFWLLGWEAVDVVRHAAPRAKIVLTLHDFTLLCPNKGLMVKRTPNDNGDNVDSDSALGTGTGTVHQPQLCHRSEPNACSNCFPNIRVDDLRRRMLSASGILDQADQIVAPSAFLRQRFIDHGVSGDRIEIIRNGLTTQPPSSTIGKARARDGTLRVGLLGNQSVTKGTLVALAAMEELTDRGISGCHLDLYGPSDLQGDAFHRALTKLIDAQDHCVTAHGAYTVEDLPGILANTDVVIMPSIWWENGPIVLEEAFAHGVPVICSNIGGMAERVHDRVDGLHFSVGDPKALADCLERLLKEPELIDGLKSQITPARSLDEIASDYLALYERLLATDITQKTA